MHMQALATNTIASVVLGHVKWFVPDDGVTYPGLSPAEWVLAVGVAFFTVYILFMAGELLVVRNFEAQLDKHTQRLRQLVPLVVRLSMSAMVFINIRHSYLLAPNVESTGSLMAWFITILFSSAAVMLGVGYLTRVGSLLLLASYLLTLWEAHSWIDIADHLEYVGVVGYLWLRGPGWYSVDRYLGLSRPVPPERLNLSLHVYRVCVGLGLVTLSLSEKLLNVTASQQFLNAHNWNFLEVVGIGDRVFITTMGAMELAIGLALVANIVPRLVTAAVLMAMATTAGLLGIEEIYGHLFAIGIVVAVWVNDQVGLPDLVPTETTSNSPIRDRIHVIQHRLAAAMPEIGHLATLGSPPMALVRVDDTTQELASRKPTRPAPNRVASQPAAQPSVPGVYPRPETPAVARARKTESAPPTWSASTTGDSRPKSAPVTRLAPITNSTPVVDVTPGAEPASAVAPQAASPVERFTADRIRVSAVLEQQFGRDPAITWELVDQLALLEHQELQDFVVVYDHLDQLLEVVQMGERIGGGVKTSPAPAPASL